MVLTSIVNNQELFDNVVDDMEDRFKTKIDKKRLYAFLNVVEPKVNYDPIFV